MSKELPGFQKSVPSRFPNTREQNPTSAWDVDLSPFHRLVEEQAKANQEMMEIFLQKMEFLTEKIAPFQQNEDSPEKILDSQKKQTREYTELKKTLLHIHDQLIEFQRLFQDYEDKNSILLESLGKQVVTARSSQEVQSFPLILAAMQKLVEIGQTNFVYLENLKEIKENQTLLIEKANTIQHFLLQLGSLLQGHIPEKIFWEEKWNLLIEKQNTHFVHVVHYLEQSVHSLETLNTMAERLENLYLANKETSQNKTKKSTKINPIDIVADILFIAFVAIAIYFLFHLF